MQATTALVAHLRRHRHRPLPDRAARARRGARKELVQERDDLPDLRVAELARERVRHVLDHRLALRLVDRLRRRADEHDAELVLPVVVVVAHLDLGGALGVRVEPGQRRLDRLPEGAADVAAPAELEQPLARIEHDPRLVLVDRVRVGERIFVDVLEPGLERRLDLRGGDAVAERDVAVDVAFDSHDALLALAVAGGRIFPRFRTRRQRGGRAGAEARARCSRRNARTVALNASGRSRFDTWPAPAITASRAHAIRRAIAAAVAGG